MLQKVKSKRTTPVWRVASERSLGAIVPVLLRSSQTPRVEFSADNEEGRRRIAWLAFLLEYNSTARGIPRKRHTGHANSRREEEITPSSISLANWKKNCTRDVSAPAVFCSLCKSVEHPWFATENKINGAIHHRTLRLQTPAQTRVSGAACSYLPLPDMVEER